MSKALPKTSRGTIWLDCDGVLLDFLGGFSKFLGEPTPDPACYNLDVLFNRPTKGAMQEFLESREFGQLSAMADPELLKLLKRLGFDLVVVTCIPVDSLYQRWGNLVSLYGDVFLNIIAFESWQEKLAYIDSIADKDTDILIEDDPQLLTEIALRNILEPNRSLTTIGVYYRYNAALINHLPMEEGTNNVLRSIIDAYTSRNF